MKVETSFQYNIDSKLEPIELLFKNYHRKNPNYHLESPHGISEVSEIIKTISMQSTTPTDKLIIDSLVEDVFIDSTEDVAVYRHIRYLPTILHSHNFFEVVCLLQGNCENYIKDNILHMTSGDICIIAPNTKHAISAFSDDCILVNILVKTSTFEHSFLDIVPEIDLLSDFFTRTLYHSKESPYLLFHTQRKSNTHTFIMYAYDENLNNRRYKRRMMNSIISAFFASLLREHEKDVVIPTISRSYSDENLVFILRYMQDHYRTITLKELAQFFNFSERHVQRIIKAATGMSFSENIQKIKMNYAAKMLENSNTTIAEISEALGYSTVNNFRNIFKKYYNMTPVEFRNLEKKE